MWALGCNEQNCWNNKEVASSKVPVLIFEKVKKIVSGWAHVVLLTEKEEVNSFGRNNLDQLGRKQDEKF